MRCLFCHSVVGGKYPKTEEPIPCCTGRFLKVNESTKSLGKGKRLIPRSRQLKPMTKWEKVLALAEMKKELIWKASVGELSQQDMEFAKKAGLTLQGEKDATNGARK